MSDSPLTPKTQAQLQQLQTVLFGRNTKILHAQSCNFIGFIEARLWQFNLASRYQASDVLRDTYLIARKKIINGEEVKNLGPWLRSIALNVIRDSRKKETRIENQIFKLIENGHCCDESSSESTFENEYIDPAKRKALAKVWDSLSDNDKNILNLRILQDLSWKEISQIHKINNSTARKRGQRALDRLREIFFSIYEIKSLG